MNIEKINETRTAFENFTGVPNSLYETELSYGAVGLYLAWMSRYRSGQVRSLLAFRPDDDASFVDTAQELIDSGIMPKAYVENWKTFDLGGLKMERKK